MGRVTEEESVTSAPSPYKDRQPWPGGERWRGAGRQAHQRPQVSPHPGRGAPASQGFRHGSPSPGSGWAHSPGLGDPSPKQPGRRAGPGEAKAMDTSRVPGNTPSSRGLFNTAMGPLQRQLRLGEYNLLKCAAMFESDFVQVSKQGGILDVHNQVQQVRVAIAATSPGLLVPDVLLLARPVFLPQQLPPTLQHRYRPRARNRKFELTRLLPLCFVKISIHDQEEKQLRFKLVTGRTFYLQLCPPADNQKDNFDLWVKVVHLLRPRSDINQDKGHQDPWKSGDLLPQATSSSATQGSEEREISIAEVLSILQEEIQESPSNSMEFLDSPSVPLSPSPTLMAIPERPDSPPLLEAQGFQEQPWKVPPERKKGSRAQRPPTSRYETRDALARPEGDPGEKAEQEQEVSLADPNEAILLREESAGVPVAISISESLIHGPLAQMEAAPGPPGARRTPKGILLLERSREFSLAGNTCRGPEKPTSSSSGPSTELPGGIH
ncbi:uncharacterized protein LOC134506510 [Candoia aspera]|uniref:uncharacterized protein LOC134506510 n=1 Tax=Candoia aspera TaxID=51853 RepID=UPI002FD7E964